MIEKKSYTRITLALDIVDKIESGKYKGYHELSVIKHQIDLCDTIIIEPSSHLSMECNNPAVPCDERNLCLQAVTLLQEELKIDKQVKITLYKQIPVMGGLAGGSANAATTLLALNEMWKLHLSLKQLIELGRKLGMDVPYYFLGKTAFDSEAGGFLEPIPTDIKFTFVLALPDFGVSTADAYRRIDYKKINKKRHLTEEMKKNLLENNREGVLRCIHNDFEESVFLSYPALQKIKEEMIKAGCLAVSLSGSGSTIFGIASDLQHAVKIQKELSCKSIIALTLK
ncbi:MAG: 4-(cytidine 5'-diphospho)-2-C-methyl-D-erythritol kinase [Chitinispirillaceae bacterium]|nr:4-(cytidine 5'-diphospho)-2-C-methyl-D-erythritol kinase [Chitinispirillaceae bacterium]